MVFLWKQDLLVGFEKQSTRSRIQKVLPVSHVSFYGNTKILLKPIME